jgi:DNA-binding IclR family transcriptional regulator
MTATSNSGTTNPDVEESREQEPDLTNKSVIKATVLLRELGRHPQGITATELAQKVRMTRPTTFRLLLTLEQTGFIDRLDNRYVLGWELVRLGRLADPHASLTSRVQPILADVAAALNETIGFAMVKGELDFDLVAQASGSHLLNVSQDYIGRTYPLHASATGKIILAQLTEDRISEVLPETLEAYTRNTITSRDELLRELKEVRQQGYATIDNELEEGLFAVGCPVNDGSGKLFGVLTANGPSQRMKTGRLPAAVERLREAADEISVALV